MALSSRKRPNFTNNQRETKEKEASFSLNFRLISYWLIILLDFLFSDHALHLLRRILGHYCVDSFVFKLTNLKFNLFRKQIVL